MERVIASEDLSGRSPHHLQATTLRLGDFQVITSSFTMLPHLPRVTDGELEPGLKLLLPSLFTADFGSNSLCSHRSVSVLFILTCLALLIPGPKGPCIPKESRAWNNSLETKQLPMAALRQGSLVLWGRNSL